MHFLLVLLSFIFLASLRPHKINRSFVITLFLEYGAGGRVLCFYFLSIYGEPKVIPDTNFWQNKIKNASIHVKIKQSRGY